MEQAVNIHTRNIMNSVYLFQLLQERCLADAVRVEYLILLTLWMSCKWIIFTIVTFMTSLL